MIAYILPTRNRPDHLTATLEALGRLPSHVAEVVVVDNASDPPCGGAQVPVQLGNGIPVRVITNDHNAGAAARNTGASESDPSNEWLVMLDDDSVPVDLGHLAAIRDAAPDVCAIQAEIHLPRAGARESGGLPEVFVGCGALVRRAAFLEAGGYDPRFGYYAEEYDLCARLLLDGGRVTLDRRFVVEHEKTDQGRDMNAVLRRLVRNNGWVMARYAPKRGRWGEIRRVCTRYAGIALREKAVAGYTAGLAQLLTSVTRQARRELPEHLWDRFTGLARARASIEDAWGNRPFSTACIVDRGKNAGVIERALDELGIGVVRDEQHAEALVVGTLSPGPILDAWDRRVGYDERVVSPWAELTRDAERDESGAFIIEAA